MDHKSDKNSICEFCKRKFTKHGLDVHILQHGKRKDSGCFKFYISKYNHIELIPLSKDSKNKKYQCENCKHWFSQLYRHISQYSDICFSYYQNKYGSKNNWPNGSTKIKCCPDCGCELNDHRAMFCINCSSKNPIVVRNKIQHETKTGISLKQYYLNNPGAKIAISKRRKKYHQDNPIIRQKQKEYMLIGGASLALSKSENPSKPQVILFNLVKELYPTTILNHRLTEINRVLDIAIPELKLDIEYDDSYWHQNKEADIIREEQIRKLGWNIIRFVDHIPTKEILIIKIKEQYA